MRFRSVAGFVAPVLVLSALVTVADIACALVARGASEAVTDDAGALVAYDVVSLLRTALLLIQLGVAGTWLLHVRRNATTLDPEGVDHKAPWAYLGWVVPFVSLFFPKQIVDDSWELTAKGARDGSTAGSTNLWWTCWIAYAVMNSFSYRIGGIHPRLDLVIAVASCVALLTWVRLVRAVSSTQERLVAARASV